MEIREIAIILRQKLRRGPHDFRGKHGRNHQEYPAKNVTVYWKLPAVKDLGNYVKSPPYPPAKRQKRRRGPQDLHGKHEYPAKKLRVLQASCRQKPFFT